MSRHRTDQAMLPMHSCLNPGHHSKLQVVFMFLPKRNFYLCWKQPFLFLSGRRDSNPRAHHPKWCEINLAPLHPDGFLQYVKELFLCGQGGIRTPDRSYGTVLQTACFSHLHTYPFLATGFYGTLSYLLLWYVWAVRGIRTPVSWLQVRSNDQLYDHGIFVFTYKKTGFC